MANLYSATTTCQNVISATAQDVRNTLDTTQNQALLIDYTNRVQLEMLRWSRWIFLLSAPQRFITQLGVTDYWLGATAGNSQGQYDTGLNLTDIRTIKPGTVFDRTNFTPLQKVDEPPLVAKVAYPDATSRPARPSQWRQAIDTPNVMNIYPAPDNQTLYSPQPEPPICTTATSGALANRLYWVTVTFVDSTGAESTAPRATKIFVPAGKVLVVNPPKEPLIAGTTGIKYDRYNVYAVSSPFGTTLTANQATQQATLISTSSNWQEPNSGLTTTGLNPPTNNAVEPIDGYIIEFRYWKQRKQVAATSDVLQIPDDYKDIVIAGVNALSFQFLNRMPDASAWMQRYREGLTGIIRDINLFPRGSEFIRPDSAGIGGQLPAIESIDLSVLQN